MCLQTIITYGACSHSPLNNPLLHPFLDKCSKAGPGLEDTCSHVNKHMETWPMYSCPSCLGPHIPSPSPSSPLSQKGSGKFFKFCYQSLICNHEYSHMLTDLDRLESEPDVVLVCPEPYELCPSCISSGFNSTTKLPPKTPSIVPKTFQGIERRSLGVGGSQFPPGASLAPRTELPAYKLLQTNFPLTPIPESPKPPKPHQAPHNPTTPESPRTALKKTKTGDKPAKKVKFASPLHTLFPFNRSEALNAEATSYSLIEEDDSDVKLNQLLERHSLGPSKGSRIPQEVGGGSVLKEGRRHPSAGHTGFPYKYGVEMVYSPSTVSRSQVPQVTASHIPKQKVVFGTTVIPRATQPPTQLPPPSHIPQQTTGPRASRPPANQGPTSPKPGPANYRPPAVNTVAPTVVPRTTHFQTQVLRTEAPKATQIPPASKTPTGRGNEHGKASGK